MLEPSSADAISPVSKSGPALFIEKVGCQDANCIEPSVASVPRIRKTM